MTTYTADSNFFLAITDSADQSMTAEHMIDSFALSDERGTILFDITFANNLNGTESITVKSLTSVEAAELPFVSSGLDLGAKILSLLDTMLGVSEGEFYADLFDDGTDEGEEILVKFLK